MTVSATQKSYLKAMGISIWKSRRELPNAKQEEHFKKQPDIQAQDLEANGDIGWDLLRSQVAECTACELHKSRTQTVFGVGNKTADWMIVGEAPGKDEDLKGEPLVGRAGQLLNQMLLAIGVSREQVFIANILKCRPPNNRDPQPEEVVACHSFLTQQIQLVAPKVILAVGRIAAQNLLHSKETIGRIRGNVYHYSDNQIPLVATYHPAYLLRSPTEKRKVWADLVLAKNSIKANS